MIGNNPPTRDLYHHCQLCNKWKRKRREHHGKPDKLAAQACEDCVSFMLYKLERIKNEDSLRRSEAEREKETRKRRSKLQYDRCCDRIGKLIWGLQLVVVGLSISIVAIDYFYWITNDRTVGW